MGYIIDTDVCVDFLENREFAVELFEKISEKDQYFISILTYYELLKGSYSKKQYKSVEVFASSIEILNLDGKIIKMGAEFYRDYRKRGITLSDIDCLIMATAKEKNLKIITRNVKHYPEKNLLSDFSLRMRI
ncbi:MAG TPA: type II toxin-antitoxin system VapC family toxin [Candidatus Desulfofervidus auxilii]|uniref:Type II toxin-antitoxin system VapC family toxin n=1 Tax=Desulfofervidus auxilii TaxID=1621989 RepID=A0A7C1VWB9_DESA2|nr:type II toxin-antitoxin system VapC family toxin [Candidatus Desulfofervidus auxilii]